MSHNDGKEESKDTRDSSGEHTRNKGERSRRAFEPLIEERHPSANTFQIGQDGNDEEWDGVEEANHDKPENADHLLAGNFAVRFVHVRPDL